MARMSLQGGQESGQAVLAPGRTLSIGAGYWLGGIQVSSGFSIFKASGPSCVGYAL